jgi:hypothetical protein
MRIVYFGQEVDTKQPFWSHLHATTELVTCHSQPDQIREKLKSQKIDAVIGIEAQLDMIKSLIQHFPMINYALISSLAPDDFHEITEGYGFFMQLPIDPQREDAERFIKLLETITAGATSSAGREHTS